ncbi:MAG: hypothetical protein H0W03_01150 [Solirubrobacterales bacterium]|jgi:hypothetical protein|nr:hypothetical protein [Solirubrobacterales bacterium]
MALRRQVEKAMILAPDAVARAAASYSARPEEGWMLRQPRAVRRTYWSAVMRYGDHQRDREIWMLRQPEAVRESYIAEVLEPGPPEGTSGHAADPAPNSLLAQEPETGPPWAPDPGPRPVGRAFTRREP